MITSIKKRSLEEMSDYKEEEQHLNQPSIKKRKETAIICKSKFKNEKDESNNNRSKRKSRTIDNSANESISTF